MVEISVIFLLWLCTADVNLLSILICTGQAIGFLARNNFRHMFGGSLRKRVSPKTNAYPQVYGFINEVLVQFGELENMF